MMITEKYSKGQLIFIENTFENRMYDIIKGSVAIYADYGTDKEKLLTTLGEGDTFGEMGMIEGKPRSATAVAAEKSEIIVIVPETFNEYFKDKPEKIKKILGNTSHRMRDLTKDYIDLCGTITKYIDSCENGEKPDEELIKKMKAVIKKK